MINELFYIVLNNAKINKSKDALEKLLYIIDKIPIKFVKSGDCTLYFLESLKKDIKKELEKESDL